MEIVHFAQRDVRNRILRRWILGWLTVWPRLLLNWSRIELLRREYTLLYGDKNFSDFPNVYNGHAPRVTIQCTNMTTGLPCSFGRSGLMLYEEQAEGKGIKLEPDTELTLNSKLSVAHGVAASSAFPPMFPPLEVGDSLIDTMAKHPLLHLTDGGVFDNMGMDRPLWWYGQNHQSPFDRISTFLVVDAEGPFSTTIGKPWRYKFTLPRNMRATAVLMKRNSTLNWQFLSKLRFTLIRIPVPADSKPLSEPNLAEQIRTDLDRFSNLEVEELVRNGYKAARAALIQAHWLADRLHDSEWCPVPSNGATPENRRKLLGKSRYRRWLPLFLGFQDWAWWALLVISIFVFYLYSLSQ